MKKSYKLALKIKNLKTMRNKTKKIEVQINTKKMTSNKNNPKFAIQLFILYFVLN